MNIAEHARSLSEAGVAFSDYALREQDVLMELIDRILVLTGKAFANRSLADAKSIEPLEETVDDIIERLRSNHLLRLRNGVCNVSAGVCFLDVLTDMERISDGCSNVGLSIVIRAEDRTIQPHDYIDFLHGGNDAWFNDEYDKARAYYFRKLEAAMDEAE